MQIPKKTNLLLTTISSMLFCTLLIAIFCLISYKTGFKEYTLASYIVLLLTGMYSGLISANGTSKKKLLYSLRSGLVFTMLYLLLCFVIKGQNANIYTYVIASCNILFGAILGAILSINKTPKKRGRKK